MINTDELFSQFAKHRPDAATIKENMERVKPPQNHRSPKPIVTNDVAQAAQMLAETSFDVVEKAFSPDRSE